MTTQCAAGSLCKAPEGKTLGNHKCCKCTKAVHSVFCSEEVETLPSDIKDKFVGETSLGMTHEACLKCIKEEKDKLPQSPPATAPPTTEEGGAADADADAHIDLSNSDDDDNTAPITTITADTRPPNPSPLTTNSGASRSTSTTAVATLNLCQAPPPSRKPKNQAVRDMYNITLAGGRYNTVCKGCGETRDVATLNITQLGQHITHKCRGATDEQKAAVILASQKGKKARDVLAMTPFTVGGSVATEKLSDVRECARSAHAAARTFALSSSSSTKPPPTKKARLSVPKHQSKMAVMTKDEMKKIYAPYVYAKVAENNPLSDLLKPYSRAALIHSHPGIGELLPGTVATIYRDFIGGDGGAAEKIKKELIEYMLRKPGDINVAHDGVTINGKSKQVYTIARGDVSCFYGFSDLGNANAEVDDLVTGHTKQEFKGAKIASLPADNAGSHVAYGAAAKLEELVLVIRDICHCVDLLSKDSASTQVVKMVLNSAKTIFNFCKIDRIDGIRRNAISTGDLDERHTVINFSETRMNNAHDHIEASLRMMPFICGIRSNEEFLVYYEERTSQDKVKLDNIINGCTGECEERMLTLLKLTAIFKRVHLLCSRQDTPVSAFPPLVQAMHNEIMAVISDEKFNRVLGDNASNELLEMLGVRFNFDGKRTPGRKVNLMDPHHIWAFYCDPFQHKLRSKFKPGGHFNEHINNMIEHFIPQEVFSAEQVASGEKTRREIMKADFMNFHAQLGNWLTMFDDPLPDAVDDEQLVANNNALSIDDVAAWIESNNGIEGRFTWFESLARGTKLYQQVAKPLLSIGTVGSIDVERKSKTLKHEILSKLRNKLSDDQAITLYGMSENMRYLFKVRSEVVDKAVESAVGYLPSNLNASLDYDY